MATSSPSPSTKLEKIMQERAQRAAQIITHAQQYKVCEGCDSIVTADTIMCPTCHSYRFDATAARVIAQAEYLATRPPKSLQIEDYT
jgi:Zn finger protein HypA/HybF involved in hydrogenase expression